ncbi:MAG: DUF3347 domain-containing protein [Chitinophagaceae bacterium]
MAAAAIALTACNSGNNKAAENQGSSKDTTVQGKPQTDSTTATTSPGPNTKATASINEIVGHYLELKNALANDNGREAATHGKALVTAIGNIDKATLTAEQKKVYDDAADDAKEMAEHIGSNGDKIEHQREHFDMLSKDMYDMVKAFGTGQTLYQDFCPMYNDKKGATWLSETKEIKNPYLGKKMPECGSVKEEIKHKL